MKTFRVIFLTAVFLFSINMQAGDRDDFGIEEDVETLFNEIEEEERQNEPQDEYSIRQDYGIQPDDDSRSPNNMGRKYKSVRKEFLQAGEGAIRK